MKHSSKKVWGLIKRLDGDPTKLLTTRTVTANQVAHQLLLNGKTNQKNAKGKLVKNKQKKDHNHQY